MVGMLLVSLWIFLPEHINYVRDNKAVTDFSSSMQLQSDTIHQVIFYTWDGKKDFTILVPHGNCLESIPKGQWDNGIFQYWTRNDTGERLRFDTPILEDVEYGGNWIPLDLFIMNASELTDLDNNVDTDNLRKIAEYIRNKE